MEANKLTSGAIKHGGHCHHVTDLLLGERMGFEDAKVHLCDACRELWEMAIKGLDASSCSE